MLSRLGGIVAGVALSASVLASPELRLGFDGPGKREAWLALGPLIAPPTEPRPANERLVKLPFDNPQKGLHVWVHDLETGNVARKPVGNGTDPIPFKATDFILIYAVRVRVEHSGEPVAAAQVTLDDGNGPREDLLAPEDHGELLFYGVKPGNLRVEVTYKFEGRSKALPAQSFEVALRRTDPVPTLTLVVSDPVPTAPVAGAGPSPKPTDKPRAAENRATPQAQRSGPHLWVYVVAIGAGLGAAYLLLRLLQSRPDQVAAGLKKLGVQMPEPEPAAPDAPIPGPIAAPAKPQPIILEDAAVTPLSAPTATAAVSVIAENPRLIGEDGTVFTIPPGSSIVGREEGLAISLPNADTVSRRHAELENSGGRVVLRDLQSTNGTFVNGRRLSDPAPLAPGDVVQFGAARFRFEA